MLVDGEFLKTVGFFLFAFFSFELRIIDVEQCSVKPRRKPIAAAAGIASKSVDESEDPATRGCWNHHGYHQRSVEETSILEMVSLKINN